LNFFVLLKPVFLSSAIFSLILYSKKNQAIATPYFKLNKYYFSASGNDNNDGSISHPFLSISKLNSLSLYAGDAVYLNGGDVFSGSILIDSTKFGMQNNQINISSYGNGNAIIDAGNMAALTVNNSSFIGISNLQFKGSGRKNGNSKDGVIIKHSKNIIVDKIDVSGFQKSGLLIYASSNITSTHVYAHENGSAGISIEGPYAKKESSYNIYFGYCIAEDNPGDPTNLTNHSGNGIVVGNCRKVMIEYCTSTNNGWDMPRIGNGPVGIWAYEADSVTIQHCLSYRNKTSEGGADGGGYDLDGGVTNSIVQYCLSYENQGAGYCIFQYLYASPWHDNIFRFNVSENDGLVSDAKAGVHIWNSSRDSNQFYNCLFYNNTIYNNKNAAISYSELSEHRNFTLCNNIFVAADSLLKGMRYKADVYLGNDWWSISKKFDAENNTNFNAWMQQNKLEIWNEKIIGFNIDPQFRKTGNATIISADSLKLFMDCQLPQNSLLRSNGIDLKKIFFIDNGGIDFFSNHIDANGIGACLLRN
jgi:hypothetical protein